MTFFFFSFLFCYFSLIIVYCACVFYRFFQNIPLRRKNLIFLGHLFPFALVLTVTSSVLLVLLIAGFIVIRFLNNANRRRQGSTDATYSVSRYWRRQYASVSFDSLNPSATNTQTSPTNQEANEISRMIKSSFSWPAATVIHQTKQPNDKEEFLSTISSSSTMEHINEQASLVFGLRWDETIGSLFVHIISAQNLFVYRHHRHSALIDSYVRAELISTENDTTQGMFACS